MSLKQNLIHLRRSVNISISLFYECVSYFIDIGCTKQKYLVHRKTNFFYDETSLFLFLQNRSMNWNPREKLAYMQALLDRKKILLGKLPFGVTPR